MGTNRETRALILERGLELVDRDGLDGITIGNLAKHIGMSKSGLFAHFGSKLELQLGLLERVRELFGQAVLAPAGREPRGEARLDALFENWLWWAEGGVVQGGCLITSLSAEFDGRPGPLRDRVVALQRDWIEALATCVRSLVRDGDYLPTIDPERFAFEVHALLLAVQLHKRLLDEARAHVWARAAFIELQRGARIRH